jgi:chromosome segregation ATPase
MAYAGLKEKLEKLLTEDLSNRSTLQDARRNLFLNSEGTKVQQQLIAEKQGEITSLNLLVEKKKTILQLKDDQINSIKEKADQLEEKLSSLETAFDTERSSFLNKIALLEQEVRSGAGNSSKVSELSIQNEEFAAKIRELIYHIDAQNTELEELRNQVSDKSQTEAQLQILQEKNQENERLQERSDLLFASEQRLKMLVSSQNNEIEALNKQSNTFKKQIEDIAAGWQMQQDQLIIDNANLLAELSLVKEASVNDLNETTSSLTAELTSLKSEIESLQSTNSDLSAELELLKESSINTINETTSILSEEVAGLKSEIQNLTTTNADLSAELELLKESSINTINETTSILSEELASIKAEKEILYTTNADLLAELDLVKESFRSKENEITSSLSAQLSSLSSEKEGLLEANAALLNEISSLKESIAQNSHLVEALTEEQIAEIKAEKEHLATELEAIKHELNITTQNREEKIISLQSDINHLQNQIISLSNSLNQETEEKNSISTQLEQLTNIITEKEQQLNGLSNNKADEEFVDKLMQQINFLSDQKNNFETLFHDSEAELNLTKANLASLTQLIDGQKNSISGLEETNKHVKLAQTLVLQANDKTVTKQAINELVREIDRCIALLSE